MSLLGDWAEVAEQRKLYELMREGKTLGEAIQTLYPRMDLLRAFPHSDQQAELQRRLSTEPLALK